MNVKEVAQVVVVYLAQINAQPDVMMDALHHVLVAVVIVVVVALQLRVLASLLSLQIPKL
jgi:hypothetical protein